MAEPSRTALAGNTTLAALGGVLVGALGFATAVATAWFTYAGKDQELRVHLVEIAVSILRADPKEDVGGAREWALEIMEHKSGIMFTAEDRAVLLHKPLKTAAQAMTEANEAMFRDWDKIVRENEADKTNDPEAARRTQEINRKAWQMLHDSQDPKTSR
jgi:hypothetical protein